MLRQHLKFQGVTFRYGDASPVISNLSFRLEDKEVLGIIGPSGSGKTTILKLASGDLLPSSGDIAIPTSLFFLQGDPQLLQHRNVVQNALLARELKTKLTSDDVLKATEFVKLLGLAEAFEKLPAELSFGMSKRVGLIQALLSGANTLLLDEPFSGLDVKTREIAESAFRHAHRDLSQSCIVVTHNLLTAVRMCHRVMIIGGPPAHIAKFWKNPLSSELDTSSMPSDDRFTQAVIDLQKAFLEILSEATSEKA